MTLAPESDASSNPEYASHDDYHGVATGTVNGRTRPHTGRVYPRFDRVRVV